VGAECVGVFFGWGCDLIFLGCSNDTFCKFGGGSHRGFSFTGLIDTWLRRLGFVWLSLGNGENVALTIAMGPVFTF
jgi:hypothetical protein